MSTSLTIRPERPEDFPAIRELVVAAFESEFEGDLVERIRASDGYVPELSFVAEVGGEVVGHAMISRVGLVEGAARRMVNCLAPVAVAPDRQRSGVGERLVGDLMASADQRGVPLVTVEGSHAYYRRFGFVPAAEHGVRIDLADWAPPEAAQIARLSSYYPGLTGRVVYSAAFQEQRDE